ncbi:hypothetical protein [Pedococcus bigeumensis]|uniref:hypothetical protein n=1 Tax=Pedococcus bigeumensis TaxID=433644 RepID=UPI00112DD0AF|nr:hypothetical protein [Pedococcus bigeumensis]
MSQAQGPGPGGDRPLPRDVLLRWASRVPVPARRPSTGQRAPGPGAGIALILVVALALAYVVTVRQADDNAPGPRVALPPRTPTSVTTTTADPDPGRTGPGVHVQVSPRDNGSLDVLEQVRFPGASTGLQIALPEVKGAVAGALPGIPRITDLEVFADGNRLPEQAGSLSTGGRVLLPGAPLVVELRYRLTGAATVSAPSTPGRALVLLPPIAADDSLSTLPVVVEVDGPGVRNLVCPGLAPYDQLCGRQGPSGWRTVSLLPRVTAVLAQVDLASY